MKWISVFFIMAIMASAAYAQTEPQDINTQIVQRVTQEHANTRKFVSDELSRQRTEFYDEMQERATYYEEEAQSMISNAVMVLSLMWAGIVLFVFGVANVLHIRLDKSRFKKLKEAVLKELQQAGAGTLLPPKSSPEIPVPPGMRQKSRQELELERIQQQMEELARKKARIAETQPQTDYAYNFEVEV